jgi:hypothetical protein
MDSSCPLCAGKLVLYYSRRTHTFTRKCFRCGSAWRMADATGASVATFAHAGAGVASR